jgi:hypothetical protein
MTTLTQFLPIGSVQAMAYMTKCTPTEHDYFKNRVELPAYELPVRLRKKNAVFFYSTILLSML